MKRLRFSLAALMLVVLAVAVVCGAIAYHLRTVAELRAQLEAFHQEALMERDRAMLSEAMARKHSEDAARQLEAVQQRLQDPTQTNEEEP